MNIVVLISGNGSNLQAIIDACKTNKIKGTVRAVFSNKADAFALNAPARRVLQRIRSSPARLTVVKPMTGS